MVKMTMADGNVLEGTPEELKQMFEIFGEKDDEKINISPADTVTHNGAVYTLVQREAQPGDVVVPTIDSTSDLYRPNVPYYVYKGGKLDGDNGYHDVYRKEYNRTQDTVKVYAPVAKEESLKVGDYAKVACHVEHDGYAGAGDIVLIRKEGICYDFEVVKVGDASNYTLFNRNELVHATDEEVAEAKWAKIGRKPNEFKKGDIVKYKSDGEICEVVEINEEGRPRVKTKSYGVCTEYTDAKPDIELITPVEARFDLEGGGDLA